VTDRTLRLVVFVAALLLYVPFLGSVRLFDWDEINFAECAREMILTGDYLHPRIDFLEFHEKPPLFIWMQVVSMKIFGINEFAARFPNALIGAITAVVMVTIGTYVNGRRFGLIWAVLYAGSLLPHFYARSGIIDPLFNLFIALSFWWHVRAVQGRERRWHMNVLSGIAAGLAVLTKGPVGWGLVGLAGLVWWIIERKQRSFPFADFVVMTVMMVGVASLWYGVDLVVNGPRFLGENMAYQVRLLTTGDAGHEQPFWYHPVVVLVGCFPLSIYALGGFRSSSSETTQEQSVRRAMIVLFSVVLVVFSLVKTKIVHYSSMTYFPLAYIAATAIERRLREGRVVSRLQVTGVAILGTVWTALAAAVPLLFMNSDKLLQLPTFRDVFLRSSLQQHVVWTGLEPWSAVWIAVGVVVYIILARRRELVATVVLAASTAAFISTFLPLVAPRIERYTQGAALEFYESLIGKDVYVKPLTFKSYAHLFYSRKPFERSPQAKGLTVDEYEPWLLTAKLDAPAYFVARVNDAERWRAEPQLQVLREHGGFIFFVRRDN